MGTAARHDGDFGLPNGIGAAVRDLERGMRSSVTGLTADTGSAQAGATPLTAAINVVTTVATAGDSVLLPPALKDMMVIVINAAALKQVPSCEYFPFEAVQTNIIGAENIVRAIREAGLQVETVVGVSTDKACKPVNTMGMTKAIQERIWIAANINAPHTRFICVRYGNVLASRGSVIPLFHEEIRNGGPLTVTTPEMTRFLLPLERAVDTIFAALAEARPGEIYIPRIASARITELAKVLMADRRLPLIYTGIRPGEKVHEILVSEEEAGRTFERGRYLAIQPMLPEVTATDFNVVPLGKAYSSADVLMSPETIRSLLVEQHLMVDQIESEGIEVLR